MAIHDFKFPDVGEGIMEGKLVSWKVKVGDNITKDNPVCEVETDKAVVEIPSPVTGTVSELMNQEGDTLNVGDVFIKIDEGGEGGGTEETPKPVEEANEPETPVEQAPKEEIRKEGINTEERENVAKEVVVQKPEVPAAEKIPDHIMEGASEIDVAEHVKEIVASPSVRQMARDMDVDIKTVIGSGPGGRITEDDVKRTKDPHAEVAAPVEEVPAVETKVEEATPQPEAQTTPEPSPQPTKEESAPSLNPQIADADGVLAMPRVRAMAKEKGIDLNNIKGTGAHGEITEADLGEGNETPIEPIQSTSTEQSQESTPQPENKPAETAKEEPKQTPEPQATSSQEPTPAQVASITTPQPSMEDIGLSGIRGAISSKMVESLTKTAQVTICDEANVTDLVDFRNNEKEKLAAKGVKLTYLPFFMKAVVGACSTYPKFNAIIDEANNKLHLSSDYNIGIATDTPKGLVVPNIFNCERKSVVQISREIAENSNAAREGKMDPKSMQNGTFSITSIGSLGGQFFTPILNYPQVAILGIGKIVKKPIVTNDDEIGVASMVTLSLTFDHRYIDGADAARFMKRYIELIEDIEDLLIE